MSGLEGLRYMMAGNHPPPSIAVTLGFILAEVDDGRARTILEAILWHGGEAEAQRNAVITLAPEDRAALLTFLESL